MLKYVLLFLFNIAFVIIGIGRNLQALSQHRVSRFRAVTTIVLWVLVGLGLLFAEPIFRYLQINSLTDSTPLSLYDVVAITAGIFSVSMIFRLYSKVDRLEQRLDQLNRELSIRLSNKP
ncbi:hypothetical protein HJC99_03800 [Candidatus Saccharibacteria bacterium]|nr:hypothetical protein [Candidatus Saccharibacteria bacterium]